MDVLDEIPVPVRAPADGRAWRESIQMWPKLVEDFNCHGCEELLLRRALKVDEDGGELVVGIVEGRQALLQLVLDGCFTDAPLSVEQDGVVLDPPQDVIQQPPAAHSATG